MHYPIPDRQDKTLPHFRPSDPTYCIYLNKCLTLSLRQKHSDSNKRLYQRQFIFRVFYRDLALLHLPVLLLPFIGLLLNKQLHGENLTSDCE